MPYYFGTTSQENLMTAEKPLQEIALLVMSWQIMDFSILWGHRNEAEQNQANDEGNSNARWPDSFHNDLPSSAIDFAPYVPGIGIPWDDTHAFAVLGGLFLAAAHQLGYDDVIYGGDWDNDGQTTDQLLMDWGHIQRGKRKSEREA